MTPWVAWVRALLAGLLWVAVDGLHAQGTDRCACILDVQPGWNLIALPCNDGKSTLSSLLPKVPEGSRIQVWRRQASTFQSIAYDKGAWSLPDTTLAAGLGVFFFNPLPKATSLSISGVASAGSVLPLPTTGCGIVGRSSCGASPVLDPFFDIFHQPAPEGAVVYLWNGHG